MKYFGAPGGLLLAALLAGEPIAAPGPVPPQLLGRWQARQISLVTRHAVPPQVQEQMNDSAMAVANAELRHHTLEQVVEFRPDGTYCYNQARQHQPVATEAGTYEVQRNVIEGQVSGLAARSSFAQWRIAQLGRRQLVLEQPIWADSLGISQQIAFRRLPPGP